MITALSWTGVVERRWKRAGYHAGPLPWGRCTNTPWGRLGGFTLIELLVVISIISLLLAIMLSGLQSARRLARRLRCAANLRSLTMAALMYAGDNDEYLLVKDMGMNPYQLDLGLQVELDRGHPDLRNMFESYLGGFRKAAGPSPLMFCPSARPRYDRSDRRVSYEAGAALWSQGRYVTGYAYWAANEANFDAIGWDWYSESDPAFRTTASPYTPLFSDPLEKHHHRPGPYAWSIASHTRREGTTEFTSAQPVGQNNARLDGSVEFLTFTENRSWTEDHFDNQFGELEVCTYSLGNPDVLFLWGGRRMWATMSEPQSESDEGNGAQD